MKISMEVITESTAISIGLIISVVVVVGGFVGWITRIHQLSSRNQIKINEIEEDLTTLSRDVKGMNDHHRDQGERMARIETLLDTLHSSQQVIAQKFDKLLESFLKK